MGYIRRVITDGADVAKRYLAVVPARRPFWSVALTDRQAPVEHVPRVVRRIVVGSGQPDHRSTVGSDAPTPRYGRPRSPLYKVRARAAPAGLVLAVWVSGGRRAPRRFVESSRLKAGRSQHSVRRLQTITMTAHNAAHRLLPVTTGCLALSDPHRTAARPTEPMVFRDMRVGFNEENADQCDAGGRTARRAR